MKEIIKKIIDIIDSQSKEILVDKNRFRIEQNNFKAIKDIKTNKRISFVDGGNLEIIKSPSFSVFFNRIYYSTYSENKKISSEKSDFYSFITAKIIDKKIVYEVECFGNELNFIFDSNDKTISNSNSRADISIIGNVIRRFAELKAANEIDTDYIIIDGSLENKYTYEEQFLDKLTGKKVCGLSKTNDVLTDSCGCASAILNKMRNGSWCYELDKHLSFLKLNDLSEYVFKFEKISDFDADELLSVLKNSSRDIIFPGYPYGLIEADKFARVTENERDMLKMRLMLKIGDKIKPYLNNSNAHDLL